MRNNDHQTERATTAYKWLKPGAIDPDRGLPWSPAHQASSELEPLTGVHAYILDGLPYGMEDELWEVELRDVATSAWLSDSEIETEVKRRHEEEVTLSARTGRLVRQIVAWTPQVAEEFARECALEARGRVLQAVYDVTKVLSDAQAEDTLHRPERIEVSRTFLNSAAELEARGREALVAAHTATLLNIWCTARGAHGSPAQLASAYAAAAASSRAAAALTYATEVDPVGNRGPETAAQAYSDERRRQAAWLAKRLGLVDPSTVHSLNGSVPEERSVEHAEVSHL